jgi:hypothetical protein
MTGDRIPVVLIGVESDAKGGQSPEHQLEELRNHPPVTEGGRFIVGEFKESGKTGYKGERGPEVQAGLDLAAEWAAKPDFDQAEVWFFKTDRAARGDGRKGRRSFLKLYADALYADVQVRAKEDDEYATRPMLVGIASEQNHAYSASLSTHVSRGKRQQRAERVRSGGKLPDGFLYASREPHPANDRRVICTYKLDPDREPVYRAMVDMSREGKPEGAIADELNAKGHRTAAWISKKGKPMGGNPFNFRSVKHTLSNPFLYGAIAWNVGTPDEEIFWDDHPGYGAREDFEVYRARREKPVKRGGVASGKGRPNTTHLLGSGFARCGRCGASISTVTTSYVRQDGTKKRTYKCLNCRYGNGQCDLPPLDAERIDRELVAHLSSVWVDFESFVEKVTAAQTGEAEKVESERDEVAAKAAKLQAADRKLREQYAELVGSGDEATAAVILTTLTENTARTEEAARRVQGLSDRLGEVVATTPVDESLDALSALRDDLRDTLGKSSIREVREGLERRFETFVLDVDGDGKETVTPILKRLPVYAAWGQPLEGEEVPTHALVSIGPDEKGSDSWESLHAIPD